MTQTAKELNAVIDTLTEYLIANSESGVVCIPEFSIKKDIQVLQKIAKSPDLLFDTTTSTKEPVTQTYQIKINFPTINDAANSLLVTISSAISEKEITDALKRYILVAYADNQKIDEAMISALQSLLTQYSKFTILNVQDADTTSIKCTSIIDV